MPVEIREMVVKAIVPPRNPAQHAAEASVEAKDEPVDHAHLVEECVAAVMRVIEKKERR